MIGIFRFSLAGILVFVLLGCASKYYPLPQPRGFLASKAQTEQFLEQLNKKASYPKSFKALSRTTLIQNEQRYGLRHLFVIRNVSELELSSLALSGSFILNKVVVNQDEAYLEEKESSKRYEAKDASDLLQKTIGIEADIAELLAYLLGNLPQERLDALTSDTVQFYKQSEVKELLLFAERGSLYAVFDLETLKLKELQLRDPFTEELKLRINYKSYKQQENLLLPLSMELVIPKAKVEVKLKFLKQTIS